MIAEWCKGVLNPEIDLPDPGHHRDQAGDGAEQREPAMSMASQTWRQFSMARATPLTASNDAA